MTRSWCQSTTSAIHDHVNTIPLIKEVLYMIMLTLHSDHQVGLVWLFHLLKESLSIGGINFNHLCILLSANQFVFTIILNDSNSSKKVHDAFLRNLSNVSTFMFRFDNQLRLKSWLWQTKVKLHEESWLTQYIPCEVCTPYLDTKISWELESWWTKGDAPRGMSIYLTNSPWSLNLTL